MRQHIVRKKPSRRSVALLLGLVPIAACSHPSPPAIPALSALPNGAAAAPPRINGAIGSPNALPSPQITYGREGTPASRAPATSPGPGDISLDFADTDIREVVAQILGSILKVNYTIDPSIHGSATLRTVRPLNRTELVPALESLLAQNGAALVTSGGLYRVGADVAIVYLDEHEDAKKTKELVEAEGQKCLLIPGDISGEQFCAEAVQKTVDELGKLDILINNAAEQYMENPETLEDIDSARLGSIFSTNIFAMFYFCKAAIPHLKEGSAIINTTSINAYKGNAPLLSYSTTKGAILAFTRSLSQSLLKKGIRVNGVAPGPIWTPFIPDAFPAEQVEGFGKQVPMKRPGQPVEVATSFVFLASEDSSYFAGQVLHPNGGAVVNA